MVVVNIAASHRTGSDDRQIDGATDQRFVIDWGTNDHVELFDAKIWSQAAAERVSERFIEIAWVDPEHCNALPNRSVLRNLHEQCGVPFEIDRQDPSRDGRLFWDNVDIQDPLDGPGIGGRLDANRVDANVIAIGNFVQIKTVVNDAKATVVLVSFSKYQFECLANAIANTQLANGKRNARSANILNDKARGKRDRGRRIVIAIPDFDIHDRFTIGAIAGYGPYKDLVRSTYLVVETTVGDQSIILDDEAVVV